MKSGEFSGHSIDEAIFHGLQELGLSIDEVDIEAIQTQSKGLFGIGSKLACVRLTQRELSEDGETPLKGMRDAKSAGDKHHDGRRDSSLRESAPRDRDTHGSAASHRSFERSHGRQDAQRRHRDEAAPCAPQYNYDSQLALEHPSGVFLKGMLERMAINADIQAAETEDGMRLRINSETKGLLIGRRGETLDAIQYITALVVNKSRSQDKYTRVTIDTEDYRSKREDTLVRLAYRQASRVKATGRSVSMEPMNPYERRVLHSALQGNPHVTTYSQGEEPNRHVVIAPKDNS